MNFPDFCIQRPVFATMLVAAMLVFGIFSYGELGVDLFPKVDLPNIVIRTKFPGAGPEEVETQVTKIIEEAVNTISGIDELRSSSFEGLSQVVVVFKLFREPDSCAQDVRDRVGRVLGKLPQNVESPVIEKFDPDAAPVITVVVSASMPEQELTEFAKKRIKESIESVYGVGQINMVGGREREIHVSLDADRLKAQGITAGEVRAALMRQNVELPGGLIETGPTDVVLRVMGRIVKPEEFANIIVREVGGSLVYVRDVATVTDSQQELRTLARLDGQNAIALVVQKQSGTNTVEVIRSVKEKLESLKSQIPKHVKLMTVRDQSEFILASFHAVMEHLILGALLASFVVYLFLGNFRSTIIAGLAIPTSLISTFAVMRYFDFSLNQMSLLALTVAVGLVIDDAIVVLENIYRHLITRQKDPKAAASSGTAEIAPAVVATTLSLVVIFVPVAFMPGIIGRFFKQFGLTMAFAIMVSMFISFTLTPVLCSLLLRRPASGDGSVDVEHSGSWIDQLITRAYMWILTIAMRHRLAVVLLAVATGLSTLPLMKIVRKDFIPFDDQSEFLINTKGPEGDSIQTTARTMTEIEAELRKNKEVAHLLTTIGENAGSGVNEGQIYVGMTPLASRSVSQFDLMAKVRQFLNSRYPNLRSAVGVVPLLTGGGFKQNDLVMSFQGPDLEKLRQYALSIRDLLRGTPGVVDLDTSLSFGKPELKIELDRLRAASLGVDLFDVASTLRTFVGGDEEQLTRYKDLKRGEEYEVRVRLKSQFRDRVDVVANLPVRARDGLVKLSSVAEIREGSGPTQIDRYGRTRQVSIFANLQGIGLGDAQQRIDERLKTMAIDPAYSYGYIGRSKVMKEQQYGFMIAFSLSAIFMYLILGAQFESFLHPLTILLSLPLSIPFAVFSLIIMGERLHLYSTLGLFMLFGIVKKNAILQIDYTNTLRSRGIERYAAIMEANRTRLRPIMMTVMTLVAGMIPMALGTGPGSGSRGGMAIVIIGGQLLCLLITLLITPVAYSLFDDIAHSRLVRRLFRLKDPGDPAV